MHNRYKENLQLFNNNLQRLEICMIKIYKKWKKKSIKMNFRDMNNSVNFYKNGFNNQKKQKLI